MKLSKVRLTWGSSIGAQKEADAAWLSFCQKRLQRRKREEKEQLENKRKRRKPRKRTVRQSEYEKDYLSTSLWQQEIRPRIQKRDGYKYRVCGTKKWVIVHHRSYKKKVMEGKDDSKLITLCKAHHRDIEFVKFYREGDPRNEKRRRKQVEIRLKELLSKSSVV
jgi:hypothetical protein